MALEVEAKPKADLIISVVRGENATTVAVVPVETGEYEFFGRKVSVDSSGLKPSLRGPKYVVTNVEGVGGNNPKQVAISRRTGVGVQTLYGDLRLMVSLSRRAGLVSKIEK